MTLSVAMSGAPLLFCPFCREPFEGEQRCPDHDLVLVPFSQLPSVRRTELDDDVPVAPIEWRFGRAELMLASICLFGGFASTFVTLNASGREQPFTAFTAALAQAPNLWAVPFAAALLASFVLRRRTPIDMRRVKLAGALVALAPLVSIVYSALRIQRSVAMLNESGEVASVEFGAGAVIMLVGVLFALVGSARFGGPMPRPGA